MKNMIIYGYRKHFKVPYHIDHKRRKVNCRYSGKYEWNNLKIGTEF